MGAAGRKSGQKKCKVVAIGVGQQHLDTVMVDTVMVDTIVSGGAAGSRCRR